METICVNVYKFRELSEKAKDRAINEWRGSSGELFFSDEIIDSWKAFLLAFDCEDRGREYGNRVKWFGGDPNNNGEMTGIRLRTFLLNNYGDVLYRRKYLGHLDRHVEHRMFKNKTAKSTGNKWASVYSNIQFERDCNLTGACYDCDIMRPLYDFIDKPVEGVTICELMRSCGDEVARCFERETEFQNSDEYISEHLEANGYEFLENGERY